MACKTTKRCPKCGSSFAEWGTCVSRDGKKATAVREYKRIAAEQVFVELRQIAQEREYLKAALELNEQQVNERLAEFAGFQFARHGEWAFPGINKGTRTGVPDFYNSLDAQARYLWGKVDNIVLLKYDRAIGTTIASATNRGGGWTKTVESKIPANASALALLAAIDGEQVEVVK